MPVPIKIKDNNSTVLVRPSSPDNVPVKSDCNTKEKVLENKIDTEIVERKEADIVLQNQIDEKQDKIKYIEITSPMGYLDESMLNLLIRDYANKIVYNDEYYALSTKTSQYRRYLAPTTDPNVMHTVLVDVTTGRYVYSEIPNAELQNHIADNERHVNPGERDFWNNKLNFETYGEILEFNRN